MKKLTHTQLHLSLCECVCRCTHTYTHTTHAHSKEKTANIKGGDFYFPKRQLLCKYHIIIASMKFQVSDFYIYTQTPASGAITWNNTLLDFFLGFQAPSGILLLGGFSFGFSSFSTSQSTCFLPYVLSTL